MYFWGPGRGAEGFTATLQWLTLDGEAATPVTKWDGRPESLAWVPHDVTSLPYQVRQGDVAVIGVGGGRDILSAIWGHSRSITGIEINRALVELLERRARDVCRHRGPARGHARQRRSAGASGAHDRSGSTSSRCRSSTRGPPPAPGAFTLSENGLYTREGWRILLDRLTPRGVFSVSRWFSPSRSSETSRLVSLAVAALLDRHVASPAQHLVLAASGNVATLLVSPSPFDPRDREAIRARSRSGTASGSCWRHGTRATTRCCGRSRRARHRPRWRRRSSTTATTTPRPPMSGRSSSTCSVRPACSISTPCRRAASPAATFARRSRCSCCSR